MLGGGILLCASRSDNFLNGFACGECCPASRALETRDTFKCTGFGGGTGFMLACGTW